MAQANHNSTNLFQRTQLAMALAAANMFVNAGSGEFEEGTYCYDNPDDPECAAGAPPPPEFLAQGFAGNHFVEDMVQDMGFEYSFTENEFKPEYLEIFGFPILERFLENFCVYFNLRT